MMLGLYVVTDSESRFRRSLCNFIYTWLPRLRSRRRFDALNSETSMHREISADRWDARDTLIEKRTSSTRRRSVPFGLSLPSDPFAPITMFPSLTLSPCNRALTYPHMVPQPEVFPVFFVRPGIGPYFARLPTLHTHASVLGVAFFRSSHQDRRPSLSQGLRLALTGSLCRSIARHPNSSRTGAPGGKLMQDLNCSRIQGRWRPFTGRFTC
jgi:hypothetical protein